MRQRSIPSAGRQQLQGYSAGIVQAGGTYADGATPVVQQQVVQNQTQIDNLDSTVSGIDTDLSGKAPNNSPEFGGTVTQEVFAYSDLPPSGAGATAFISDSSTDVYGDIISGGGGFFVGAYFDGSVWRVG